MSLPRKRENQRRRSVWFRVSTVPKQILTRSEVGFFEGHWISRNFGSVRCPGEGCTVCAAGRELQAWLYVFVEVDGGEVLVWNIPNRLRELAEQIDDHASRGLGLRLALWREKPASNAPILHHCLEPESIETLDIDTFVDTLGRRDLEQIQPRQSRLTNAQRSMSHVLT